MDASPEALSKPNAPPASRDPHHALKAWIAAILWLIVIAIESTDWLSAHHTSRILYPMLHYLFGLTLEQFEPVHFFIRKGGHVSATACSASCSSAPGAKPCRPFHKASGLSAGQLLPYLEPRW